jgi:hypothetical protein
LAARAIFRGALVVGRIFLMPIGPRGDRGCERAATMGAIEHAARGYEPTREASLVAFAKSWRRPRRRAAEQRDDLASFPSPVHVM